MGIKLLNGVESAGENASILKVSGKKDHTVSVSFTTSGSVSAMTVSLEGSIDGGLTWHDLAAHSLTGTELTNGCALFHVTDKIVDLVRVNLDAITESGTTSVDVWYS